MKVALFVTCFNDTMFPESAKATVELLERLESTSTFRPGRRAAGRCTSTPATAPRRYR
jgi:L-lactate dehydrogenase complex protein LldE